MQVDVATLEENRDEAPSSNGAAVAVRTWTAPPSLWSAPAVFPDTFEVRILHAEEGPRLVAAIEMVSPANKDRPESRRTFASKCAGYLAEGVSLMIVDVVTSQRFNLHNELMDLMRLSASFAMAAEQWLYASAYRPIRRGETDLIDIWPIGLQIGATLPTLPLFPAADLTIPVELEAAYVEACEKLRIK